MKVSISRIKTFKACRRAYQLKYIENLVPAENPEALEIGKHYHKIIEDLNNGADIIYGEDYVGDFSKELAMARAYMIYIYPKFKVIESEKHLTYDLGDGDVLVGIADGIAEDGHIVEHKTTGQDITEAYEYGLQWDEQILAYMLMTGMRKVWYTVIRKPTIRQKQNETDEAFFYRMIEWYDTDTEDKIRLMELSRSDEEVQEFLESLKAMVKEMKGTDHFYRNTCHCNMWGRRCEYSSICLHYDPNMESIEFVRREEHGFESN